MNGLIETPEFWVMVAFFLFAGLLIYYKVPHHAVRALDRRAQAIQRELDEARRLREEAEALLASYRERQKGAEDEVRVILDQARREAEAMQAEARRNLEESLERRTRQAEEQIARAEARALQDVRAAAVEMAIAAARTILAQRVAGEAGQALIEASIRDLRGKLH